MHKSEAVYTSPSMQGSRLTHNTLQHVVAIYVTVTHWFYARHSTSKNIFMP